MLSHGGGTVPFIAWRLTFLEKDPSFRDNVPQGVMSYLRRLYLDTALCASRYALPPMRELVGVEHILFGTDYAFAPEPVTTATVRRLGEFNGFNSSERQRVERDNALTLFPRLRERLPAADGGGGRG
jgi:predicted TIM-barrel fold metal-dependent hydrolase